jgi:hypothetical protein
MRRGALLAVAAGVLLAGLPAPGLGSPGSEAAPCLKRHRLPAYTVYTLGASFSGLARVSVARYCYAPGTGRIVGTHPTAVAWYTNVTYGTCTPEGLEGGCGPPLEIESWPECDRNFSSYGTAESPRALPPRASYALSGSRKIPTAQFERGLSNRIEMYTGRTTIVIFSDGPEGPALATRAAHALARLVAPSVRSIPGSRLRAEAVSTRGCAR